MTTIASFAPIVDATTEILILGSIPGIKSLEKVEYYGNKHNQFWKIICTIFNNAVVPDCYKNKVDFLLQNRIGLWDVVRNCERKGSLDIAIKNQEINDFDTFLNEHPKITTLLFNGKTAYQFFYKKYGQIKGITYYVMPSTSPANTMTFEKKLNEWSLILSHL
ncbi:G:T/U mismatch-specific uracil/thymine DNA-glycosylase [Flavobacterium sp. 9R]|uniref:DNA-deoxyinosine glycosylase n=1 Tax=Flavobacterium sp. 9R TaxID=2653143 RepID=UPI0012F327E6|nr:DNA-deoxyinosine glycosylase [Flavobacterium sp. 9R]VXB94728.1 G:T/U mismatch-specific uracil/thymine DNA-glycosylase [Flavobacterium sp. 9R]